MPGSLRFQQPIPIPMHPPPLSCTMTPNHIPHSVATFNPFVTKKYHKKHPQHKKKPKKEWND